MRKMPMSSQDENRSPDAVKLEVKLNTRREHVSPTATHFNLGLNFMTSALYSDPVTNTEEIQKQEEEIR